MHIAGKLKITIIRIVHLSIHKWSLLIFYSQMCGNLNKLKQMNRSYNLLDISSIFLLQNHNNLIDKNSPNH